MRVNVTARDIRKSEAERATKDYRCHIDCPIAHALQRHKGCAGWAVGRVAAHSSDTTPTFGEYGGLLPPDAVEFVRRFDRHEPVEPFSFELSTTTIWREG